MPTLTIFDPLRLRVREFVLHCMQEQELTYSKLCAKTGLSLATYVKVVGGRVDIHLSTLVRIANTLGYDVIVNFRKRGDA